MIPSADAVRWLITALAGRATADELPVRLAERITARGDMVKFFAGNLRYAAFREHEPYVESLEPGRAIVLTGPLRWELTAAIEERRPYRIISFAVHELPDETLPWAVAEERMPAVHDDDLTGRLGGLPRDRVRQEWPPGERAEYSSAGAGPAGRG